MTMATYIRISSQSQKTDRQEITAIGKKYIDKISGAIKFEERPKASQLKEDVLSGEVSEVRVKSVDRLGRSSFNIQETIQFFMEQKCQLFIEQFGLYLFLENGKVNSMFKLISDVLSNVAEMERENMLERQREGIAIAKAKGNVYKGRKPGTTESRERFLSKHKKIVQLLNSKVSIRNTAKIAEVSPQTVQKVKRYMEL
jgi:DNA invertase Pin-like site-specific DNA recombinase